MAVSIVIPVYNEEKSLPPLIEKIKILDIEKEIIVIDDGSDDKSFEKARHVDGIKLLRHEKNLGKGKAIRTGIENSKNDIIVTIDCDMTYPEERIPEMIRHVESGYDMVVGSRFLHRIKRPCIKLICNLLLSKLVSLFTLRNVRDISSGFRAFKRNKFLEMCPVSKDLTAETEMTIKFLKNGHRYKEIEIPYRERKFGKSKMKLPGYAKKFFITFARYLLK